MNRLVWAAAALWLISAPAMAQVYKCESSSGTVFQGTPCAADAEALSLQGSVSVMQGHEYDNRLAPSTQARIAREKRAAARQGAAANRRHEERQAQQQQARIARQRGMVAEGASGSRVTSTYGRPDRVNVSQSGGDTCKHMYWDDPYRHVTVCGGKVRRSYKQD